MTTAWPASGSSVYLAGGQPRQTSKRQALRRLQQRAALQGLNGQSTPHADPLHNAPGPFPTHTDPSNGILGHSEPSTGLQSSPLLSLGAELGFPGRPVFEGGTPSEIVSAGLLLPGQQGEFPVFQNSIQLHQSLLNILSGAASSGLLLLHVAKRRCMA